MALDRARALMEAGGPLVVLTGAGISAESGVPTFRGEQGLWRSHRPEELATPGAFRRDPLLVWAWYQWRRDLVSGCEPNDGHRALAELAMARGDVRIVTQNVDGLHEVAARHVAGEDDPTPALPTELHGSLFVNLCPGCGRRTSGREEAVDASDVDSLPRCDRCDAVLRPGVVWFGEGLDPTVLAEAFAAARAARVCLVVGTSAVVHPAASLPLATLEHGGIVIEVNPEETPLTPHCAVALRGPSGSILPELVGAG